MRFDLQVKPEKVNLIIGTGGKKIKSIIEECGIEAIDTQDDGIVRGKSVLQPYCVIDLEPK